MGEIMATKTKGKVAKKKSKPAGKKKAVKLVIAKKKARKSAKSAAKITLKKSLKKATPPQKHIAKTVPKKKIEAPIRRGKTERIGLVDYEDTSGGSGTGGQSGDTQGLSGIAETDSESVKELLEEGQAYEAEVIEGVESVPDADRGEVRTHQVPEDDVPEEYRDEDAQK
jgi:hypothetical protein